MGLDTRCVSCGRLSKDGAHVFFKCKKVVRIWQIWIGADMATKESPMDVIRAILILVEEIQRTVVVLMYSWWNEYVVSEKESLAKLKLCWRKKLSHMLMSVAKSTLWGKTRRRNRFRIGRNHLQASLSLTVMEPSMM